MKKYTYAVFVVTLFLVMSLLVGVDTGFAAKGGIPGKPTPTPTPSVPAAPSDLHGVVGPFETLWMTWVDNADNEDGFYVEGSADGVNYSIVATTEANFSLAYFPYPNVLHYFRVSAFNSLGTSGYSNTIYVP